ncbi:MULTISPECIES: Crp/Fnr family transcriptional regulator [unclassified Rhizobium]|uniref:Crp/Fnr family transcriptional regulator n=1 Tax=unclassified Rhizobium TaxID=2613769 RepID=UPI0038175EB6
MLQANNVHHLKDVTNPVLFGVAPDSLQGLFRRQPVEHLCAGQSLFLEGDAARHLFEVVEGSLRIFRIISDGRRVITGFLHASDMAGVSMTGNYLYSAEAVVDTRIRRISRKLFDAEVAKSPELQSEVFSLLRDEMADAQDQMVLLSRKSAEERLCSFLLRQAEAAPGARANAGIVALPMTRLDIADYLGLTIETVSRTITKLTQRGIICPVGRHAVQLLKHGVLVQLSGDGEYFSDGCRQISYAAGNHH